LSTASPSVGLVFLFDGKTALEMRRTMDFQVGTQVVHRAYGPGEITQLEEKVLSGQSTLYYVVQFEDLTAWVPVVDGNSGSLRLPTPVNEFDKLFTILSSPAEPVSADRLERKRQLLEQIKDGTLESICRVIRDLTAYGRTKKLSESDHPILERAKNFLLHEWGLSRSISITQAERELSQLLSGDPQEGKTK
jgi:RNA polymerase-interacting CarD/CdnL/TRCF family regulator